MARVNDTLYINIGTDSKGSAVMTVYRPVIGGHIIVNELHGRDATMAYSRLMKYSSEIKKEDFKNEFKFEAK